MQDNVVDIEDYKPSIVITTKDNNALVFPVSYFESFILGKDVATPSRDVLEIIIEEWISGLEYD